MSQVPIWNSVRTTTWPFKSRKLQRNAHMELWNPKPLSKGAARKQRARQRLTAEERNDVRDNDRKRKRLAAAAEAVAAALFSAPPVSTPGSSAPSASRTHLHWHGTSLSGPAPPASLPHAEPQVEPVLAALHEQQHLVSERSRIERQSFERERCDSAQQDQLLDFTSKHRPMLSSGVAQPGWAWDDEWHVWYHVEAAEAFADAERRSNAEVQQYEDDCEVRHWLQQQISELESDLCSPSYSIYEIDRLRTIVRNNRVLLDLAQAALRDAPLNSSSVHLAFLQQEYDKAQSHVLDCVSELERVEHASN